MKKMIASSKTALINTLITKVAAAISDNLANSLNGMLASLSVPTALSNALTAEALLKETYYETTTAVQDNTNPALYRTDRMNYEFNAMNPGPSQLQLAMERAKSMIYDASFSLAAKKVSLDAAGILDVGMGGHLSINGTLLAPGSIVGHGSQVSTLKPVSYSSAPKSEYYDFSLAVSDP